MTPEQPTYQVEGWVSEHRHTCVYFRIANFVIKRMSQLPISYFVIANIIIS